MERFIRLGLEPTDDGFHLHALAANGEVVKRKLPRARFRAFFAGVEPTLVGVAARKGAPRLAKRLAALGHDVRLLPQGWAKLSASPARRGPARAKLLCRAVALAGLQFAAVTGEGGAPGPDDQVDYFTVARRFARHVEILRATAVHDLIEGAERIESADLAPVASDDPWLELAERFAANASILRSVTVDAFIKTRLDPSETPAVQEAGTVDRPRARALFVRPTPRLGDAPSVKSRDALVASIDAAALARLQELNLASGHLDAGEPAQVRKLFRCLRRLRAVAQTGLFLHDYYAYQARIEGSPFTIFMHYLNEVPEMAAQPNPLFNTNYYLIANRGARRSRHPFIEYALYRRHRGAATHWAFSDTVYAERAGVATRDAMAHCVDHYAAWAASESRSPLIAAHAACDTRAVESLIFDPAFYGLLYDDVAPASPDGRAAHYQEHGVGEGRFGCVGAYLRGLGVDNFFVPVDFDPVEYGELNPDVATSNVSDSLMFVLEHFLKSGLREGRYYTRKAFAVSRAPARRADGASPSGEDLPVGIFVHMFYPDMWPGIRAYLRNMRLARTRLFVNLVTSSFDAEVFQQIRGEFPDAHILVSPNEGRDIGGLFRLFAEADFGQFSAVAICHSKKSPHLAAGLGQTWMRDLMDAYADTPETFAENLRTIQQDPHVGLIASAKWRRIGVGEANDRHYKLISSLLPALKGQIPEYPSGTMFLAKPAIVEGVYSALKHLEFENGDGVELKFHIDGQIAHSVERAFGHMARSLALDILWR